MENIACFEWVKGFDQDHQSDSRLDKASEVWSLTLAAQREEDDLDFEGGKPDGPAIFATVAKYTEQPMWVFKLPEPDPPPKVKTAWRLICDDLNIDLDLTEAVAVSARSHPETDDVEAQCAFIVAENRINVALIRLSSLLSTPYLRRSHRKIITEPDQEEEEVGWS